MDPEKTPLLTTNDLGSRAKCPAGIVASPGPESFVALQEQDISRLRIQRRKRICAHLILLTIFVLFASSHFDLSHVHGHHPHRFHPHQPQPDDEVSWMENFPDESSDLPVFPELMIRQCAEWPEGELNSSVQHTFELPIDSELLFLVARGPSINGNVNITQSDEEGDSAVVSIRTHYDDKTLLDSIKLCDVVTREGGNGVGLLSSPPHPHRHMHNIYFDINVAFPKHSENSPLVVSDFRTEMHGIFGHQVANLSEAIVFNSVSLTGAYKPVKVNSLQAHSVRIESPHSPIEGNFTVRKSLRLSTANARINITANLLNDETDEDMTELIMNTANSPIEASVSLFSVDAGEITSSGGAFRVRARNANSPVKVAFPTAPINSTVVLDAKTAVAPLDVQMHGTFEGAFTVHTTPFDKRVVVAEEGLDPEGKGRKRNLIFDRYTGGISEGTVFWGQGEPGKQRGSVRLDTVSGQVSLKF
ncbi:hypothetical protein GG344DRAFT_73850 [Lentinula edodes]|nr:hypothetical protein GG344DRAFT_73850 [Lentinula edodes]